MKCFLIKSSLGMQRGPGLFFSHCDLQLKGWSSKGWSNFLPNREFMCEEERRPLWHHNKGKGSVFSRWQRNTPLDMPSHMKSIFQVLLQADFGPAYTAVRLRRHPKRHIASGLSSIVFLASLDTLPLFLWIWQPWRYWMQLQWSRMWVLENESLKLDTVVRTQLQSLQWVFHVSWRW